MSSQSYALTVYRGIKLQRMIVVAEIHAVRFQRLPNRIERFRRRLIPFGSTHFGRQDGTNNVVTAQYVAFFYHLR